MQQHFPGQAKQVCMRLAAGIVVSLPCRAGIYAEEGWLVDKAANFFFFSHTLAGSPRGTLQHKQQLQYRTLISYFNIVLYCLCRDVPMSANFSKHVVVLLA